MTKKQDEALQALLGAELNVEDEVFIKRLGVNFKVKAIGGREFSKLQEQSTHYVGKGTNRRKEVDEDALNGLLIAEACLSPNFSDTKLMEKYDATDGGDCVQKALKMGEIAKLSQKVLELSGFTDDEDEVKN